MLAIEIKYLDSECHLQVSEKEIVKTFYRKSYLDFTPHNMHNAAFWYFDLLVYNVGQQDMHKLMENTLSRNYWGMTHSINILK